MSHSLQSLVQPGPARPLRALVRLAARRWLALRSQSAPAYRPPTPDELTSIEQSLTTQGMPCADYRVDPSAFRDWRAQAGFPSDYHGGAAGGVYDEKLLEHYVAWQLLSLSSPSGAPYVDVAACASPWAKLLRERGIEAHAIDLAVAPALASLDYYHQADATRSPFADASIGSASLQCAFEMFTGDSDTRLVTELARILRPGGRALVSPLYMHTHACHYQTPEYLGQATGDADAKTYVRRDIWGVASSRKYSAATLRARVWEPARHAGLVPSLLVLRNGTEVAEGIYLHFILVLDKPGVPPDAHGATP
jgi:SAM-dependent methyltransferase